MGIEAHTDYDLAVLGGGLAGLTLARQLGLERPGTRIAVLEKGVHPAPESAFKIGESSVELAGRWFRDTLQLKDHLDAQHLPKLGLRYFLPGDKTDITRRPEYGPLLNKVPVPFRGLLVPSYQLDRGRLENHLAADLPQTTAFLPGCAVASVELDKAAGHTVRFERQGEARSLTARWVVDASGRRSLLKRQLGLAEDAEHHCNSAWFRVEGRVKVDDWSDDPEWQARIKAPIRWQSTCQLLGRGYWIWIIALAPGRTSIGVVADQRIHPFKQLNQLDRCREWMAEHEPLLAAAIDGLPVLDFATSIKFSTGCRQLFSEDRWGITGDAGVFTDPFYSPGSDFIAIANGFNLDLIKRDLDGQDIGGRPARAHKYLHLFYEQFMRVYRDHYATMGNPQVMAAKIAFDNAFYWGWAVLLFQNGALCDVDFMDSIADQVERSVSLQGRVEQFLREWRDVEQPEVDTQAWIDQFDLKCLWAIYTTLIRPVEGDALRRRLHDNLDRLEALAEVLFRRATAGDPLIEAAGRIDVHKITLDSSRWDEIGLFGGPDRSRAVARMKQQLLPLWIDGSVDVATRMAAVTQPSDAAPTLVPDAAPAPLEDGGAFDSFGR